MKKPWVRPPGCECDEKEAAKWKCTAQWMRCNARIAYVMRTEGVPMRVKVGAKDDEKLSPGRDGTSGKR